MNKTIIKHGSDRKVQIVISDLPDDMSMEDIDFNVAFRAGGKSVSFAKSDLVHPSDNIFIAPLETKNLGIGDLWLEAEVLIPDDDFKDGIRNELYEDYLNATII